MKGSRKLAVNVGAPLLFLVLVIGIWALVSTTIYADRNYLIPRPWQVVHAAWTNRTGLFDAVRITFTESVVGFVAAIVVGLSAAIAMSQAKALERSFYPFAVLLQTAPIVAIAPIIVLWFGFSERSVMIASFIIALFPILTNSLLGLLSTDRNQVDLFHLHHANRLTRFVKLHLPAAVPNIVVGMKISAGLSVVGAIVGEFIIGSGGTTGGLGVQLIFAQSRLQTDLMFAQVFLATALGLAFFMLASGVGALTLRHWHESALKVDS